MSRILLVEDNRDLAAGLIYNLEKEGHEVIYVSRGNEAIDAHRNTRPHLIILDMMLPEIDGFVILSQLRERGNATPVLCLTALGAEVDKVRALRSGADDYITKPFGLMELLARVEALLRRYVVEKSECLQFGDVIIDVARRSVTRGGQQVSLSPKEFDLLVALGRQPDSVISRQQLMKQVWGHGGQVVSRTVDTHIASLRSKLEPDPAHPNLIVTSWKAGYKLAKPK